MESKKKGIYKVSSKIGLTVNPGRSLVETLVLNPAKPVIHLSLGDPTLNQSFKPCPEITDAMISTIKSNKFNGYLPSAGTQEAREAVAKYWARHYDNCGVQTDISWEDVFITSGCSHSLDMCMTLLCEPGTNILVPKPGFPVYLTLSAVIGVEVRYYRLLPDKDWEIDLQHLESMIDNKTSAIIYNNPSNPCGSVYSAQHIHNFMAIAQKHNLPVIADEIYEDIVFPGKQFYPCSAFNPMVPVLACGAISKKFLTPGWRLGWIVIRDPYKRFGSQLKEGLNTLSQRQIVANSIAQGALPQIISNTPQEFFDNFVNYIHSNAQLAYEGLSKIIGLHPIMPSGAMYIMVRIDTKYYPEFDSDLKFIQTLAREESVVCFPGSFFQCAGYMRIVLSVPTVALIEALNRIDCFCYKYSAIN